MRNLATHFHVVEQGSVMENLQLFNLDNGIRVCYKPVHTTKTVHCGFIINVGSRDENPEETGIAHFWEHMAFKGTQKRKAFHIINSIDSIGGELNAYTTKEKICFYASVLDRHFERAVELLTDITFQASFPESLIEKERNVILEEMAMYKDTPEDAIQDDFEDMLFEGHAMGHNILGSERSVSSFRRQDFLKFIQRNLNTSELIFSVVGNVKPAQVHRLMEKYLKPLPYQRSDKNRWAFHDYKPQLKIEKKQLNQAQVAIGSLGFPSTHPQRLTLFMVVNILGGPFMNSRLNLALRERRGYVYNVEAHYSSYSDTGTVAILYGTDPNQVNRSLKVVHQELKKIKHEALGTIQLHRAKEQIIGQLAMAEEHYSALMLGIGKSLIDRNRIESFEEIAETIRSTTSSGIMEVANQVFPEDRLSSLIFTVN